MTCEMEQMLKDEARRSIAQFWKAEDAINPWDRRLYCLANAKDEDLPTIDPEETFLPLAYSTIDDSTGFEHDWQAYADLNRICITHVIDGMFEHEDKYSNLESFIECALDCLEWDGLYQDGCTIVDVFEAQGKFKEV